MSKNKCRHCFTCTEEHRKEKKAARDRELQAKALVAMNGQLRPWAITGHRDRS